MSRKKYYAFDKNKLKKNFRVIDGGEETAGTELNVLSENQIKLITPPELINHFPGFFSIQKAQNIHIINNHKLKEPQKEGSSTDVIMNSS